PTSVFTSPVVGMTSAGRPIAAGQTQMTSSSRHLREDHRLQHVAGHSMSSLIGSARATAIAMLLLGCKAACVSGRSSSIRSPACCAAYQHSDSLPDQSPPGVLRLAVGGDSRNDSSHVVPWAFKEAKRRGANAFLFLGDLEFTRAEDRFFAPQLVNLGGVPFYPVIGNHEVELFGVIRLPDSAHAVKEFKEDFLKLPGLNLAPLADVVAYSADFRDAVHFVALDNVSRKGEGFGKEQLTWLEADLSL